MHASIIATEYKYGNKYHLRGERFDPDHAYPSPKKALLWALHVATQIGTSQLHVLVDGLVRSEIAQLKGIVPAVASMALTDNNKIKKLVYFFPGRE